MSINTTLPSSIGPVELQIYPEELSSAPYGQEIQHLGYHIHAKVKTPFTVNRIDFTSASMEFHVNADGTGFRVKGWPRTYVPGESISRVTSDKSREKISNAMYVTVQMFMTHDGFAQFLRDADTEARNALAALTQGHIETLLKKIEVLKVLADEAQNPSKPYHATLAKLDSVMER